MSQTFANSIDSNPIYAQRAEQDASGNNIAQTYATKSELPSVPVTDVTVDGVSVVSSGTAAITMPTIPVTDVEVDGSSVVSGGVASITIPAQVQADWTESDSSDPSYIANKPTLAAVATSGDYGDLSNTPTINNVPAVTSSDDNKVLKASYTGGVGSYSWEAESGGTVTDVEVDGTSVVSGGVASITMPTELVPTVTYSDDGKVLKAAYSGGTGSYSWETESGGGGTQADWAEADPLEPDYIQNKPVPKTLVAGTNITISENSSTLTVSATWQNAQADWTETDPNEPAYIQHKPTLATVATSGDYTDLSNTPTVDQTYDGTSANAQSGVAVASGISDAIGDLPTNLTAAQIQALKEALGCDETVLYYNASGAVGTAAVNLSESIYNFERVRIDLCSKVHTNNWVSTVEAPIQYITNNYLNFCFTERFDDSWRWITWRCDYPITNSGTTITLESTAYGGALSNGNWSSGVNVNTNFHLYKVVGIHRVASN